MKKLQKILVHLGLAVSLCLGMNGTASAANDPFTCSSNFYQVISGQLKLLDPLSGNYTDIGSAAGFTYNGIGYNVLDNYIYGFITSGAQTGDLIRVGSDGTTTDLGLPAGLPAAVNLNGSLDLAGNLYVRTSGTNIYKVNVSAMTATALTISGDPVGAGADSVFINNKLYYLVGSSLSVVDLGTNTASTGTVSGPSGWLSAGTGFGAAWTDQAGELFFSNNSSGSIYQITSFDTPTPTANFKVAGTVTSNNDGAGCPLALQSPFDPPIANNDSFTTPFNTPLNGATSLLNNDLGNTLVVTAHTNPLHGTVSINPNGTFLYTPNNGFSGTDSFDYTVTDSIGRTASARVTITVSPTLAPDTGNGTPNHANPLAVGLSTAGSASIGGGLLILYRQRRTKTRKYTLVLH